MRKLAISGLMLAMVGGLAPSAEAATAPIGVDTAVGIKSTVPVPGGFTAGSWKISNVGSSTAIPAGTTYLLGFDGDGGFPFGNGYGTATAPAGAGVTRLNVISFQITLTQDLAPGQTLNGVWSLTEPFPTCRQAKAYIRLEHLSAGYVDVNGANDESTYDNNGQGF